jgi:hypothetical protein
MGTNSDQAAALLQLRCSWTAEIENLPNKYTDSPLWPCNGYRALVRGVHGRDALSVLHSPVRTAGRPRRPEGILVVSSELWTDCTETIRPRPGSGLTVLR